jgi:two-component system sensor histidine kinase PilS (NtrC family)
MPDGGEIAICSTWRMSLVNESFDYGRILELTIMDTGSGISSDDMSLIFEPFFTTKPGGSGLGLATVYRILEAHSGSISVENHFDLGTKFTISIPVPYQT